MAAFPSLGIVDTVPSMGRSQVPFEKLRFALAPLFGIEQGDSLLVATMHRRFPAPEQAQIGGERQGRFRQAENLHHRFVDGLPGRIGVGLARRPQRAVPELREGRARSVQRAVVQCIEERAWNPSQAPNLDWCPPRLLTLALCPMGDQTKDGIYPQGTDRPDPRIAVLQGCP